MNSDVTVVVATIPPRADLLPRALDSIRWQTQPPRAVVVEADPEHTGSSATYNRAIEQVKTPWFLVLADDDQLMPYTLQVLTEAQRNTGAHVVSGPAWIPQVSGHHEPTDEVGPGWVSAETVMERSRLTGTSLMATAAVRAVGGFEWRYDPHVGLDLDDYGLYWKMAKAGYTFWRVPETVFVWHVNGRNTSGRW